MNAINPLPPEFAALLDAHHVLSLAVCDGGVPWAASVFYCFDAAHADLIFLSHAATRHAQMLLANARAAGTVAGQPADIAGITGLQIDGVAQLLDGDAAAAARALYDARFPAAKAMPAPVWRLRLLHLKLVDNRIAFGHKARWERHKHAG